MAQPNRPQTRPINLWPGDDARHARDRRVLRIAVVSAVAIHVAAMWLPIPRATEPEPLPPKSSPPTISRPVLKPPEVPESPPAVIEPRNPTQPLPIPRLEDELEPDAEPLAAEFESATNWASVPDEDVLGPGEAPPEPTIEGPLPIWTPGLVNPVPWPDRVRPEYPPVARRAGIDGRVTLRAIVDKHGRVQSLRVIASSSPDLGFSEAAIEAVSQWRYDPGRYRDKPVDVEMTVVVVFEIN